ncbi:MAG: hypothetical protein ACOVMR_00125 [Flavobacteriales bacterium]|jgi:hypothetical protein
MTTTKALKLFLLLLSTASVVTLSSCKKDEETIATVLVLDNTGKPVPGVSVRLFGEPSEPCETCVIRFDTLAVTNGTGKVTFDFSDFYKSGQAGFAVLNIEATKGSLFGEGIIKIEEEKTTEESITIE